MVCSGNSLKFLECSAQRFGGFGGATGKGLTNDLAAGRESGERVFEEVEGGSSFLWWSCGVKKKKEDVHYRILHGFARLKNAFSKQ